MSWQPEVDGIQRRRELALEHGGPEAVSRQHDAGRLAVRERTGAHGEKGQVAGSLGAGQLDGSGRQAGVRAILGCLAQGAVGLVTHLRDVFDLHESS